MPLKNKQTKSFFTSENYYNMHRTAELLMETPFYKKTLAENIELKDKIRYLKYTIEFLEMKNKDLQKKLKKRPKRSVKNDEVVYVEIKKEPVETIVIEDLEPIKYEIVENIKVEEDEDEDEEEEEEEEEEEDEEVIVASEEEEVIVSEEEEVIIDGEEEEEVIIDGEEEEEVIIDGEEEEEVIIDGEEEEVIVASEEEEVIVASEEEEVIVDADAEEEEADGVYEIVIKGRTYYVSNEIDSFIYQEDENGDISMEVGKYIDSKATFYKK